VDFRRQRGESTGNFRFVNDAEDPDEPLHLLLSCVTKRNADIEYLLFPAEGRWISMT
jgi:poly-D-alanine transfer protein DltD